MNYDIIDIYTQWIEIILKECVHLQHTCFGFWSQSCLKLVRPIRAFDRIQLFLLIAYFSTFLIFLGNKFSDFDLYSHMSFVVQWLRLFAVDWLILGLKPNLFLVSLLWMLIGTLFRSSTCALTGFFWLLSHMIYLKLTTE